MEYDLACLLTGGEVDLPLLSSVGADAAEVGRFRKLGCVDIGGESECTDEGTDLMGGRVSTVVSLMIVNEDSGLGS